ncbi:fimbria/pilus outer membrane usher protein [Salmonella enterica subsp. enterica]
MADLGVGVGVLDVSIYEKNGQVQNYTVPYSTPVLSLPDGYSKYSVTIGRYREVNNDYIDPVFLKGLIYMVCLMGLLYLVECNG